MRRQLQETQWTRIEAVLASQRGPGRPPKDDRNFVEAVLWWRRTGVLWRDLPEEFGPWKTVFDAADDDALDSLLSERRLDSSRHCGHE